MTTGTLSFQKGDGSSLSQDDALKSVQESFSKVAVGFGSHKYLLIVSALKILAVVQFYQMNIVFPDKCGCNIIRLILFLVDIQSHFTLGVREWQRADVFLC